MYPLSSGTIHAKSPLSPREEEVLRWTACGKTSDEIATVLELSNETIRKHIKSICQKLNANNKVHAVALALTHGILGFGASPERVIPLPTLLGVSKGQAALHSAMVPTRRPIHKKS